MLLLSQCGGAEPDELRRPTLTGGVLARVTAVQENEVDRAITAMTRGLLRTIVTGALQATAFLSAACGGSSPTAPTRSTPTSRLIVETVSGAVGPVDLEVGQSEQLAALLHHGDGTREPVASVTWESNDPAVATVTTEGTVTGQAPGETGVWARRADGLGYVEVNVTHASRPVDAQFDDRYWQELVFDQGDRWEKQHIAQRVTTVLETTSPNFYIRRDNPGWPDWPSDDLVARMRGAIPRLAEQLTGQPYRGRIEAGDADREEQGWISVVFERLNAACGRARVGADPGRIRMSPDCFSGEGSFLDTFTHEVGHAFGFWHVTDFKAAMWNGSGFAIEFNAQEQYHARLAYEVGRGQPYAGWPFQFGPAEGSQDWPTGSIPVIVIDD